MSELPVRSRLEAKRFSVKQILELAARGELRLPIFQRPLRWRRADHELLLDSLYQGYPVGTLLLWERDAPLATVTFGPVQIDAGKKSNAFWIVDGQQRVTSIVACLSREAAREVEALGEAVSEAHELREFEFCFDLRAEKFVRPPRAPTAHLVPVGRLRSAVATSMWATEVGADPELHRQAQAVGERLREYEIPAYALTADDQRVLRTVFDRANSSGRRMQAGEIFDALNRGLSPDDDPQSLLERLAAVAHASGFGAITSRTLQKTLVSVAGLNPRHDLPDDLRAPGAAREFEARTAAAIGRVVAFLRDVAGIPHAAALPYELPVIVLARFFDRFPAPAERSLERLSRWVWRGIHTQTHMVTNQVLNPAYSSLSRPSEDEVVRGLLEHVGFERPARFPTAKVFNPRGMRTRTDLVALFSFGPLDLEDGRPLEPVELFEPEDGRPFPALPGLSPARARTAGGRLLLRPVTHDAGHVGLAHRLKQAAPEILATHAIPSKACADVRDERWDRVAEARQAELDRRVELVIERKARWHEDDDGPALTAILDDDAYEVPP